MLKLGVKWRKEKASKQTGGGPRLKSWGGLLLSPFVVVAPITVPDSFGVIKENEKPLLLMLFSLVFGSTFPIKVSAEPVR